MSDTSKEAVEGWGQLLERPYGNLTGIERLAVSATLRALLRERDEAQRRFQNYFSETTDMANALREENERLKTLIDKEPT